MRKSRRDLDPGVKRCATCLAAIVKVGGVWLHVEFRTSGDRHDHSPFVSKNMRTRRRR